jgi:hypothetical protein
MKDNDDSTGSPQPARNPTMTNNEIEDLNPETGNALNRLLQGAIALTSTAEAAMSAEEVARLHAALDAGAAQFAVTIILPTGAVRVGIVGDWDGDKTLWEMTPDERVMERTNLS